MVCAEQPEQTERAFSVNVIVPNSEGIKSYITSIVVQSLLSLYL